MKTKKNYAELAKKFADAVKAAGWTVRVHGQIITITKNFTPGDKEAFVKLDGEAFDLLSLVPLTGGSVCGTDGGSVGGHFAVQGGQYKLNKSFNGGARFKSELEDLMPGTNQH